MPTPDHVALIRAAASLARSLPERMHAAHLVPRLERLAAEMAAEIQTEQEPTEAAVDASTSDPSQGADSAADR